MAGRIGVASGGPVTTVLLGDGTRRNALRHADWVELGDLLTRLVADRTVRCIVLRGRGGHFCAGSDLRTWATAEQSEVHATFAVMELAFRTVEQLPVPVIAVVEGAAAGAGCQLALACDLRVLVAGARIGMPTAALGIQPTPAFAARLSAQVGPGRARALLYTGRMVGGPEAAELGLAECCAEPGQIHATLDELTASIVATAPEVVTATKAAVARATALGDPTIHDAAGPTVVHRIMRTALARYRERSAS